MTARHVELLTDELAPAWERFVRASGRATCAHLLGWRNVVAQTYRHTPLFLMAFAGEEVQGVLPLFLVRSPFFGRFLVTAPYLSYGGLCASTPEAGKALLDRARELRRNLRARYLELRNAEPVGHGLAAKTQYCIFTLPLDPAPEVQWERLKRRARTSVRKAQKSGLTIEVGTHLLPELVPLLTRHVQALGTPFHGEAFYRAILREFPGEAEILLARAGQIVAAGALILSVGGIVYCVYGGALEQYKATAAMSYLYWEIIRYGCLRGCRLVDFGRSRWDSGTFQFKEQWAASSAPLFYEYDLADGVAMPDMDPANPKFRWARATWKRLPGALASRLGPLLIKDIP